MKKITFLTLFLGMLLANNTAFAQSKIKDGTITNSSDLPDKDAIVEFESTNKGVLLPKVALTATNLAAPLSAHIERMLVYNTATSGTAPNNVSPGFYYNTGSGWLRIANASTVDSTNDGWKDDAANALVKLAYKSDGSTTRAAGTEFVIKDDGKTGIGTATPTAILHTKGSVRLEGLQTTDVKAGTLVVESNGDVKIQTPAKVSAARASGSFNIATTNTWQFISGTNTEAFDNLNELSDYTFTAKNDGVYSATLVIRYPQRSTGADSDGYIGASAIFSTGTGPTVEVHSKVPIPESGGFNPILTATTNTAIFKLTAGQKIQFQAATYGSVSTSTSGYLYDISIYRVD